MTVTWKVENGDVVINRASGRTVPIGNRVKATQSLRRLLGIAAPKGAGIDRLVGTSVDNPFAFSAQVQRLVSGAFARFVRNQALFQSSQRTPEERLTAIVRQYCIPKGAENGANNASKTDYVLRVDAVTQAGPIPGLARVIKGADSAV